MRVGTTLLGLAVVLAVGCQGGGREPLHVPVDAGPVNSSRIPTGAVTGQVVDAGTGKGLAGALVSVEHVDPPVAALTDAGGTYVLFSVPQGQQFLDVAHQGYEPYIGLVAPSASPNPANVFPNQTIAMAPIVLTPVSPSPSSTPTASPR